MKRISVDQAVAKIQESLSAFAVEVVRRPHDNKVRIRVSSKSHGWPLVSAELTRSRLTNEDRLNVVLERILEVGGENEKFLSSELVDRS